MRQPDGMSRFEFVVVSSLRAAQLMRGCVPHIQVDHKRIVVAQMEVIGGSVVGKHVPPPKPGAIDPGIEPAAVESSAAMPVGAT
jgi:hypothetical protein